MTKQQIYLNLSRVQPSAPRIYPALFDIKALPYMVQSFAIRAGGGKALAVFGVYMLAEVPAALVVLAVGLPQPWRSCCAEKSSYQKVYLRKEQLDEGDDEDAGFTWECACFSGSDKELPCGEFYGLVGYEGNACEIVYCNAQESKVLDNWAYLKVQLDIDGYYVGKDVIMSDIGTFCTDYSYFIAQGLAPVSMTFSSVEQLFQKRFSLVESLSDRSLAFANEIFVDFEAIDEKYNHYVLARKNQFYPGKFVSASLSGEIAARIGTFRAYSKRQLAISCVDYKNKFLHVEDGQATLVSWAKACCPYKNGETPKFKCMVFVFSFFVADSDAALSQAAKNYEYCSVNTLLNHFSMLYRAFQEKLPNGEPRSRPAKADLKISRPVLSTLYGSLLVCFPYGQKDICLTIPRFIKTKRPELRYPVHKSGTIYLCCVGTTVFLKEKSPFEQRGSIKAVEISASQLKTLRGKEIQYCVENFGFQTYKYEERLPSTALLLTLLDLRLLYLIFNKQSYMICSAELQDFSGLLDESGRGRAMLAGRIIQADHPAAVFPAFLSLPQSFRGQFNACANMYDCCMMSFLRYIDQSQHADLVKCFYEYDRARTTTNYFNFGRGLYDQAIFSCLERVGIHGITEDNQEIALPR